MASIGKCIKCNKTVYQIEGLVVAKQAYHKACFKCMFINNSFFNINLFIIGSVCGWKLDLHNYKNYNEKVYCPNHYPVVSLL